MCSNVLRLDGIVRGAGLPQGELPRRFAMVPSLAFGNHVAGSGPQLYAFGDLYSLTALNFRHAVSGRCHRPCGTNPYCHGNSFSFPKKLIAKALAELL